MSKKVFVTGIGIVGPCGNNTITFWNALLSGNTYISSLQNICNESFSIRSGGQVKGIEPEKYFTKRFLNKCSRFSVLSLLASKEALESAGLNLNEVNKKRVGIFVGNNSGGWESAQKGLEVIYTEGTRFVSPFLASNWFPAAAQGHISLAFGVKGFSKTVIADRASGLLSIGYATKVIRNGILDIAIAGGVETPLNEWGLAFYESSGLLCNCNKNNSKAYKPFDRNRNGMIIGEGSAFLILESEESIVRRGAKDKIKANIQGFGISNDGAYNPEKAVSVKQCARAISNAINNSSVCLDDINYISLDGVATKNDDIIESESINYSLGEKANKMWTSCPKVSFGNTIGAAGAFDVALAVLTMNTGIIPKTNTLMEQDQLCKLKIVKDTNIEAKVNSSLVISRGFGGISSALVINNKNF